MKAEITCREPRLTMRAMGAISLSSLTFTFTHDLFYSSSVFTNSEPKSCNFRRDMFYKTKRAIHSFNLLYLSTVVKIQIMCYQGTLKKSNFNKFIPTFHSVKKFSI